MYTGIKNNKILSFSGIYMELVERIMLRKMAHI
jgi:hypothetical protein